MRKARIYELFAQRPDLECVIKGKAKKVDILINRAVMKLETFKELGMNGRQLKTSNLTVTQTDDVEMQVIETITLIIEVKELSFT